MIIDPVDRQPAGSACPDPRKDIYIVLKFSGTDTLVYYLHNSAAPSQPYVRYTSTAWLERNHLRLA